MNLIKTIAFQLHVFLLVAALGLGTPTVAPAQNNGNWALQQQRMMQSQRATQQAQQAQRAAQEAARIRQQQLIEQQRRQQAMAAQQRVMREQQRIQREQQQVLRAQREQQRLQREQQQVQRTQQQAVRTQRQQQEAARQSREQQERLRTETAQRQATQAAQRQSTLTAAQHLNIRNRLQQTEQTKRLEEARRRAQQALERRKADEARMRAETNAVVAARSSGGTVAAAAAGGGSGKQPPLLKPRPANDNDRFAKLRETEANDNVRFQKVVVANIPKSVDWRVTSGAKIAAHPEKTTTILGSYWTDMKYVIRQLNYPKTYDFGPKKGGLNVLNTPNNANRDSEQFWRQHNKPFLEAAVRRGDRIILATKPDETTNLKRYNSTSRQWERSGFGREIDFLKKNGYIYDSSTNSMIRRSQN